MDVECVMRKIQNFKACISNAEKPERNLLIEAFGFIIFGMFLGVVGYNSLYYSSMDDCPICQNCQDLSASSDEVKLILEDNNLISRVQMYANILSDIPFNSSNTDRNLTLNTFMNEGGVCVHYAKAIHAFALEDGFYAQDVTFAKNETNNHMIEIVSDNNVFCVTSNNQILGCMRFKT